MIEKIVARVPAAGRARAPAGWHKTHQPQDDVLGLMTKPSRGCHYAATIANLGSVTVNGAGLAA
jgi:hypothetical protein